jgi:hypothetical protein
MGTVVYGIYDESVSMSLDRVFNIEHASEIMLGVKRG